MDADYLATLLEQIKASVLWLTPPEFLGYGDVHLNDKRVCKAAIDMIEGIKSHMNKLFSEIVASIGDNNEL